MDLQSLIKTIDRTVEGGLDWLTSNGAGTFGALRAVLTGFYKWIEWLLLAPPTLVVAVVIGLIGWRTVNWRFGIAAAVGIGFCVLMGLSADTMKTLALVISATILALLIAIPIGILAGFSPRLNQVLLPILDMMQTLPPYIYLLPAIALLGYGPATALAATVIVAIPPALRLTAHGIRLTPLNFLELGRATGTNSVQMFTKIRLPFAMPSIIAGINQCIMMAVGMVVIAGIVGSGGLGTTIYDAMRTLDIGKSVDGGIAIVVLAMILDRITEGAVAEEREAEQ